MTQRWVLDEIVDPFGAKVLVERDAAGAVSSARFDLAGLPRVDALLAGQPVTGVPNLVEKLCGICPAAHHLAGVRALEALAGSPELTPTAKAVRALLHYGSALETHAPRLISTDRETALAMRRFGKAAMAAAGSPGHFPTTAVVGGVKTAVSPEARDGLAATAAELLTQLVAVAVKQLQTPSTLPAYAGADVALVDPGASPDLLGERVRAVAASGATILSGASASAWDGLVAEQYVGAPAPRPYLVALGPDHGRYRVGPMAQLRVGDLTTPIAAGLQRDWLAQSGDAGGARAIMTVHAVEAIIALLDAPELVSGEPTVEVGPCAPESVGVGWVDGARGLLVHRYQTGADGRLTAAQILTPTAQNEPWLADLLLSAAAGSTAALDLEDAVREADPCLPCSSAPVGGMGLQVDIVSADGGY
ncbi:MAG: reducing hydrogenase subunit alpha [Actinobacteria bacterium]|nr:reducing hydrogenase subunit alpha [Actinomycetota bacterium]